MFSAMFNVCLHLVSMLKSPPTAESLLMLHSFKAYALKFAGKTILTLNFFISTVAEPISTIHTAFETSLCVTFLQFKLIFVNVGLYQGTTWYSPSFPDCVLSVIYVSLWDRSWPKESSRCQTRRGSLSWRRCSGTLRQSWLRSV